MKWNGHQAHFHMLCIVLGRYGHFSYSHIVSLWDRDKLYYRAWVGGGKRETLCTCHRLFHNYLVILNYAYVRKRACLVVGLVLESVFKTFPMRTRSIKVQVYFTFHVPFRLTQLSKYEECRRLRMDELESHAQDPQLDLRCLNIHLAHAL